MIDWSSVKHTEMQNTSFSSQEWNGDFGQAQRRRGGGANRGRGGVKERNREGGLDVPGLGVPESNSFPLLLFRFYLGRKVDIGLGNEKRCEIQIPQLPRQC